MIRGAVNADLEAIIPLLVQDATGQAHAIDALIDTGFDGYLTLPLVSVAAWGLPRMCHGQGVLADGTLTVFDVYEAIVIWDGQARSVEPDAIAGRPLVGMGLLAGYHLHIESRVGGSVVIEALP